MAWPTLLTGVFMVMFFVPVTGLAMASVEPDEQANAAGISNFMRTLAGAFATSLIQSRWSDATRANNTEIANAMPHGQQAVDAMTAQGIPAGLGEGDAVAARRRPKRDAGDAQHVRRHRRLPRRRRDDHLARAQAQGPDRHQRRALILSFNRKEKTMTALKWMAVAAALTIASGAVPASAKVAVDQTSSTALARGSTFAWAPTPALGIGIPDPTIANEITADRLRLLTEAALAAKGYRMVGNPTEAELLVSYTIVMLPETGAELSSVGSSCRAFCDGPGDLKLDERRYTRGTLVLDLTERQTGRLVFRATSDKRITPKDASQKKLTALLKEMTKSLPAR